MVYHELRNIKGRKLNYMIYNKRVSDRWEKKSKYLGEGDIPKKEVEKMKKDFEIELEKSRIIYLKPDKSEELEKLRQTYWEKTGRLSKEEFENFEASFFTELTYNSNAIEGSSLSLQETSLAINENIAPKGKSLREIYEAKNHKKAIEFLKSCKEELDELIILKVHSIIMENITERFAGNYRENPVRVIGSNFKFPSPDKVPQLVKNLVYWYKKNKKELHPFELAVLFSAKLVSIHPFVDGNGRVSRLLMNFILQKNNFPWINIYMKQREDYLKAVRKANDEDYTDLLVFLVKTLRENLKDFGFI